MKLKLLLASLFLMLYLSAFSQMVIVSGHENGTYYQFIRDITTIVDVKHDIEVSNQISGGSAQNYDFITGTTAEFKMALIQSDFLSLKRAEDRLNDTRGTKTIKVVMELAVEEVHVITKKSAGIKSLKDLEGKKVAVGSEFEGSRVTSNIIKAQSKVDWIPYDVSFQHILKELSEEKVDAAIVVGSAPLKLLDIDPIIMKDGIHLVEISDYDGWAKHFDKATIKKSDYPWLEADVPTIGVRTLLVVNESKLVDDDKQVVQDIKQSIIDNLNLLKEQGHPKWQTVKVPEVE